MELIWSDLAKSDFEDNIDYLLREWSERSAVEFINKVDHLIELLSINPQLFPESDYKSVRRAVVTKQITLFYKLSDSKIYLIRFWNTYQNPAFFRLK